MADALLLPLADVNDLLLETAALLVLLGEEPGARLEVCGLLMNGGVGDTQGAVDLSQFIVTAQFEARRFAGRHGPGACHDCFRPFCNGGVEHHPEQHGADAEHRRSDERLSLRDGSRLAQRTREIQMQAQALRFRGRRFVSGCDECEVGDDLTTVWRSCEFGKLGCISELFSSDSDAVYPFLGACGLHLLSKSVGIDPGEESDQSIAISKGALLGVIKGAVLVEGKEESRFRQDQNEARHQHDQREREPQGW